MCEQTEINYLDGDVVWVKLGACWWPGQVTSFHNLPEDIQIEFQKKPLIAAVKFFQEDTYEFVKNLQQIYKYNCTQKDDFIRKGLDKYRAKSKDGSSYMDKFPGDVEMAEKLTGGDPEILSSDKFSREQKPDISALFGEKKVPKKKRDEANRRMSDGGSILMSRKITHPRFVRESDHEIRIRQQPSNISSSPRTPSTDSPQYSCNLCSFTSTRVNVIICHRKSHCSGGGYESPIVGRAKITGYSQPKNSAGRSSLLGGETHQKRKYVRKTKSLSSSKSNRSERPSEPIKRKLSSKQSEKNASKKKKTDPELREKLLADWDDETDEEMEIDLNKSTETMSDESSSFRKNNKPDSQIKGLDNVAEGKNDVDNNYGGDEDNENDEADLIKASEKLLRETEKLASFHGDDSSSRQSNSNKNHDDVDSESDNATARHEKSSPAYKKTNKKKLIVSSSSEEKKATNAAAFEKDEKHSSRFSCFDFDEDDGLPEATIAPVRKIPRIFGEKNTSVKKEILKKFTMSQALKSVKDSEKEEQEESEEKAANAQDFFEKKEPTAKEKEDHPDMSVQDKSKESISGEEDNYEKITKMQSKDMSKPAVTVTELEIVEIFEVEGEKEEREDSIKSKSLNSEIETFAIGDGISIDKNKKALEEEQERDEEKRRILNDSGCETVQQHGGEGKNIRLDKDDVVSSEQVMTETEDETISEMTDSLRGNSENSDTDGNINNQTPDRRPPWGARQQLEPVKSGPRRRGRPRKSLESSSNQSHSPKQHELMRSLEISRDNERKTSESDSERSYTGRRRKPNKKYLPSDVYASSSPDNRVSSKTDESQSETDEKSHIEQNITRSRRGKNKLLRSADSGVGSIEKTKDQQRIELFEETVVDSSTKLVDDKIFRVNEPQTEMEIESESPSGSTTSARLKTTSSNFVQNQEIKNNSGSFGLPDRNEQVIETVMMTPEDMEMCLDEAKNHSKLESLKSNVDKLPPKKSQIKKFELSQIDLLDACAEQVAAEQAAADKLMAEKYAAEKLEVQRLESEKKAGKADKLAAPTESVEKLVADYEELPPEKSPPVPFEDLTAQLISTENEVKVDNEAVLEEKIAEEEQQVEKLIVESGSKETEEEDSSAGPHPKTEEQRTIETVESSDPTIETIEAVLARITNEQVITSEDTTVTSNIFSEAKSVDESSKQQEISNVVDKTPEESAPSCTKETFVPDVISKVEKSACDEEVAANSFQDAFLKTLHIDKKEDGVAEASAEETKNLDVGSSDQSVAVAPIGAENNESLVESASNVQDTKSVEPLNAMTEFEGVEILVQEENLVNVEPKIDESVSQIDLAATLVGSELIKPDVGANLSSVDLQKIEDSLRDNATTALQTPNVSVPVKKREKPRIIENVALKEPMQILKNKLLEKLPSKSTKHKLDSDEQQKKMEARLAPRAAKLMKVEPSGNRKARGSPKSGAGGGSPHLTITKKLQVLKAEEAATAAAIEKEKAVLARQTHISQMSLPSGEKFIQQSSQSLTDMELDINSMPFVLSEDVLTPESIEQMPVVISSIIPASSSTTSDATEATTSTIMLKKKSGMPAILKSKSKAKPTITSIKTLMPPFTGGLKGLKFQSQQTATTVTSSSSSSSPPPPAAAVTAATTTTSSSSSSTAITTKETPVASQKSTTATSSPPPGKYVVVRTAGGQQLRYSVQGKPGSHQKIAIPSGKGSGGSAQIVQQGGKVVILTSAQSGQTKMLPLNISKSMGGKVQKIVSNKAQVYTSISPTGIMGQKAIIAPKTDTSSGTTSKLVQGQKIINPQGIITSKGVLTSISTSKSGLLSTLSQGILTKDGIYTPISSAQLTGKAIIGGKTLVSKAATGTGGSTTILSSLGTQQIGGTSKGTTTILAPMSHGIGMKTINAQGLVTTKGTVLTPITGQQVKAIAAKNPPKAPTKLHYQTISQKLQLPVLQKSPKVSPVSTQIRAGTTKSPCGSIVFHNTNVGNAQKTPNLATNKKIIRQISPQQVVQQHQGKQLVQRAKTVATSSSLQQRLISPRGTGRQSKQKIIVQKMEMPIEGVVSQASTINVQSKQTITSSSPVVIGSVAKTSSTMTTMITTNTQSSKLGKTKVGQKNVANVNTASISSVVSNTLTSSVTSVCASKPVQKLAMPSLVIPGTTLELPSNEEAEPKKDPTIVKERTMEVPKLESSKLPATQPQIMALPTESTDGTQTYVLVTIDEQGQIQPLDNNTLMSLEGTSQNPDGTRTLYIDPSSLGEAATLDNIVLQFDNGGGALATNVTTIATNTTTTNSIAATSNVQPGSSVSESAQTTIATTEHSFSSTEIIQSSNQDILAAALANTDFQQEIGLADNTSSSVMTTGLTQTSLINQTILQSTIIPPTDPISSPSVLETSLTLNQPIMTPLEVPSSLPIQQVDSSPTTVVSTIPSTSLELPITITNPAISYISAASGANQMQIQIPGNSMPDIGEIMDGTVTGDIAKALDVPPTSTQYLVLPVVEDDDNNEDVDEGENNMAVQPQDSEPTESNPVTYGLSVPDKMSIDNSSSEQRTPSMPIIDDGYVETPAETFSEEPINEVTLVSKSSDSVEMTTTSTISTPTTTSDKEIDSVSSKGNSEMDSQENHSRASDSSSLSQMSTFISQAVAEPIVEKIMVDEDTEKESTEMKTITEMHEEVKISVNAETTSSSSHSSEIHVDDQLSRAAKIESTNDSRGAQSFDEEVPREDTVNLEKEEESFVEQINSCSLDSPNKEAAGQVASPGMEVERESDSNKSPKPPDGGEETLEESCKVETASRGARETIVDGTTETSQEEERPSQSFEELNGMRSDSVEEVPSQSASKSENNCREPSQSVEYEAMEIDENTGGSVGEPPSQSFKDTKRNEASQSSYEGLNVDAPTQSFNEMRQCQEEGQAEEPTGGTDGVDDQSFPTQSYEVVAKVDNDLSSNLESDASAMVRQEEDMAMDIEMEEAEGAREEEVVVGGSNIPSQSNDIGNNDGIGTSSVSGHNTAGLNEDETASSSYVPETPENQERDQDQESAISTSSYEILPCEELNIASSSVIPDTSVRGEHMSIHDNGVPEIPTSSYNLNPDSSSSTSHVDALPTSSYEEQQPGGDHHHHVIVTEQNVSTSYDLPISMSPLEERSSSSSHNFVTDSTTTTVTHRDEPSSYYASHHHHHHHQHEVTASYYEPAEQDSNRRARQSEPAQQDDEVVTPSYYEQTQDITSEASQSYFRSSQSVSPSYYDPTPETEATQSSYYSHDIEPTEHSSSRNVEASQSFYQETTTTTTTTTIDDSQQRLTQRGEATPTYTGRYPLDYALENSPIIERHDLVESSVPTTRSAQR